MRADRLACESRGSFLLLVDWLDIPGSTMLTEIMWNIWMTDFDLVARTWPTAGMTSEYYRCADGVWILRIRGLGDPPLMRTSLRLTSHRQPHRRHIIQDLERFYLLLEYFRTYVFLSRLLSPAFKVTCILSKERIF